METREQLQDWIRSGMPVPEEPQANRWACAAFTLKVWPLAWLNCFKGGGQAGAQCEGCGMQTTSQGATIVETLRGVEDWMATHAVEHGRIGTWDAEKAFHGGRNWGPVARVMRDGKAETFRGRLEFPGDVYPGPPGDGDNRVQVKSMASTKPAPGSFLPLYSKATR